MFGNSDLLNAVSGSTGAGGTLTLNQTAVGGVFGGANSTLQYSDGTSALVAGTTTANGGNGDSSTATSIATITSAHTAQATANATGGNSSGIGGGIGTAAASATSTGTTANDNATATATVQAGKSGTSSAGRSLIGVANAHAENNGVGAATATVNQTGGLGGDGFCCATVTDGGNGGASVLNSAASGLTHGGTLNLLQTATGGDGGVAFGSTAGNGGEALSNFTATDTTSASASVSGTANGGNGGNDIAGGVGGAGGGGQSTVSLNAKGNASGYSTAGGGSGGSGDVGSGLGGQAIATSNVSSSTGTTYSSAVAFGGVSGPRLSNDVGGLASSMANATSTGTGANATATAYATSYGGYNGDFSATNAAESISTATTAHGQTAVAQSYGNGSQGTVQSTATSNLGSSGFVTAITSTTATLGGATVASQANGGTTPFGIDNTGLPAYAFGTVMPTGVPPLLPGSVALGAGVHGAGGSGDPGAFITQIMFGINPATVALTGDLFLSITQLQSIGNGFDSMTFSVSEGVVGSFVQIKITLAITQVDPLDNGFALAYALYDPPHDPGIVQLGPNFSMTFGDLGSAQNFFGQGLFDLGPVPSTAAATPVPAALPLFATGLAGLGWLARRRRKQAAA